eukprot:14694481-Alexandrium_andersonii.AAC.1
MGLHVRPTPGRSQPTLALYRPRSRYYAPELDAYIREGATFAPPTTRSLQGTPSGRLVLQV